MKKKFLFTAILVAMSIPAIAGEAVNVPLSVTVMKGSEVMMLTSINAIEGMPTPIEISRLHPYRASAARGKDGKIVITPGTFKTGVVASLTPTVQKDGKVEADILIDLSELVAMKSITSSDGLTVDAPEVNHITLKQKVVLTPNTPVTLTSDDYTVKVLTGQI